MQAADGHRAAHRPSPPPDDIVVVVPVKSFGAAKERLAGVLSPADRSRLARGMADRVLAAAAPLRAAVVCDDLDVAEWAGDRGARVLWVEGGGLDRSVGRAVARLAVEGTRRVVVAHGDLPLAAGLGQLGAEGDGVALVPDRHLDGTNVVAIPAACGFRFSYGPGSFQRHVAEAERLGLEVRVVTGSGLALDVDSADDLAAAVAADPTLLVHLGEQRGVVPVAGS